MKTFLVRSSRATTEEKTPNFYLLSFIKLVEGARELDRSALIYITNSGAIRHTTKKMSEQNEIYRNIFFVFVIGLQH